MPDKIPFGYDELVNAIADAIEMAEKRDGATVVDTITAKSETHLNFNDVRNKAQELWMKLVGTGDTANPEMANTILKKIEMTMGRRMKLSEFTEDQVDLLNLVVMDMEELEKTQG
jgi:PHP family Zn ribbon phosphoesterase